MQNHKPYTAINASAGSGKTYALVLRVLMICLAYPKQPDAIKHILALTFTNKAANEMKERILNWLKSFTKEDYAENGELKNIQSELKARGINVSLTELHERAQNALDYILHHYSTLNIGTIDKFNARLVRSFSYELGLAHQFNLEIQSEPYLIEAVDKLLDSIGTNDRVSDAFMDFVNYNLDNDERVNINKALYGKAKKFISDVHYEDLKNNENFDWEAYETTTNRLRAEIAQHKKEAMQIAEEAANMMKDRALENADFYGGNNKCIKYFFDSFLDKKEPKLMETPDAEAKKVEYYRNGASKVGKPKEHLIEEIVEKLIADRTEIINHYIQAQKKTKILRELLPLKINKEIQDQLALIEEENDLVLLSKFNIIINENLKNEPSGFIYEKTGTKFQHFFFDEFQDTSKMQWDNILPLKDHTVNSDKSSFTIVGDPKQSIYRFRGGDSDLMLNILNGKEKSNVPVHVEVLGNNWRSARNIVDFNNALYEYLSSELQDGHRELFSNKGKQEPKKSSEGRVKVCLTDYDRSSTPFFENVSDQMQRAIQECTDGGFQLSDITILCRSGAEIQKFSQLLGSKKINYKGEEIYIKTISEKGLTLELSYTLRAVAEFLKWEIQPKNRQYLVKMLYLLQKLGRITLPDFSEAMFEILQLSDRKSIEELLESKYGLELSQKDFPNLNLYNYIEYFVHEFSVEKKETDFLLNFLETLYNFTQNSGLTVKDFIKYWEEEASKISVQASANIDAVKLMTIHAAKGLEFPVVFLPMRNAHKDGEFSEWLPLDGHEELKSVNISGFTKELTGYDAEMEAFNQINTYKNKVDRFCIQYVATTRPVEQLFLFLERPSKSQNHLELYDFVNTKNKENADEFDLYPEKDGSYQKQNAQKESSGKTMEILKLSQGHENLKNIKIATPSKSYQTRVESVRTGIFTHEILSKINSTKDIQTVLERYLISGEITRDEAGQIKERIENITENENFSKYFSDDLKIINEKDILISSEDGAQTYRPDRLIETKEGYYIIDFKTGTEKDKHEKQLATYQTVLEQLGKTVLNTEIIYI